MNPEARKVPTDNQVQGQLYDIWLRFWKGGQTSEDSAGRQQAINTLFAALPEQLVDQLTLSEEGQTSVLAQIREDARVQALNEITVGVPKKISKPASRGEKLHIRRVKASQRRGKDPKNIH